jgi:hypothetical protein
MRCSCSTRFPWSGCVSRVLECVDVPTRLLQGILCWGYIVYGMHRRERGHHKLAIALFLYAAAWTVVAIWITDDMPAVFQVQFLVVVLIAIAFVTRIYLATTDPNGIRLFRNYVWSGVCAIICWAVDRTLCDQLRHLPYGLPNPQLHAWWHILMAFNCYFGALFGAFCGSRHAGASHTHVRYSVLHACRLSRSAPDDRAAAAARASRASEEKSVEVSCRVYSKRGVLLTACVVPELESAVVADRGNVLHVCTHS